MSFSTVILTNYNGVRQGFLHRCLKTLNENLERANTKDYNSYFNAVIVDSGSQDNSLEILDEFKNRKPNQVHVLKIEDVDVTVAMNFAIRYVFDMFPECRFLITLDNDTALSDGFLLKIVRRANSSSERVGMFASNQYMLVDYPKQEMHRSTGHYVNVAGATLDRDFMDKKRNKGKVIFCPCLSGALLKTEMLKEIGLIPDDYLHYNNCPELGFRAQLSGWNVEFVESAIMWHNYRRSTDITEKQKEQREISRIWNMLRFFPEDKIPSSLEAYKDEKFRSSPTLEEKERLIEEAKKSCPKLPEVPNSDKRKVFYKRYIDTNRS